MGKQIRGIGLPVALVIVLFLYFVTTALVAQSRYNLRLATGSDQAASDKYAAKALVATAIAELNLGDEKLEDLEARGPNVGQPWAEQDETNSQLYHILGRVGQFTFSRVVRTGGGATPLLYVMNPTSGDISVHVGTKVVESLPPSPKYVWEPDPNDPLGPPNLVEGGHLAFDPGTDYQGAYADSQGRLFMVYHPYDPNGIGTPVILMVARGGENDWEWTNVATLPRKLDFRDLSVNQDADTFHLLSDDGKRVFRYDGGLTDLDDANAIDLNGAVGLRMQAPFVSLTEGGDPPGADAYVETGSQVLSITGGQVTEITAPSKASGTVYNPEDATSANVEVGYGDLHVGAGSADELSIYGLARFETGDIRILEWLDGAEQDDWGRELRFGQRRRDAETDLPIIEDASVLTFDVDATGQPFVQYEQGGEQFLYHPETGRSKVALSGGDLLAAGGVDPSSPGGEGSGGSEFVPLSYY